MTELYEEPGWCPPLSRVVYGLSGSHLSLNVRKDVLESVGEGLGHKAWLTGTISGRAAEKPACGWGLPPTSPQHPGGSCATACLPPHQPGCTIAALGAMEQPALQTFS